MPVFDLPTGLYWQGKRTEVVRIFLPFQTIEMINESRATREKEKDSFSKGIKKGEAIYEAYEHLCKSFPYVQE
ncbi:MAG: hypothetical protein ACPL1G_05450 [Thermodesulfovibrionales bacterium]